MAGQKSIKPVEAVCATLTYFSVKSFAITDVCVNTHTHTHTHTQFPLLYTKKIFKHNARMVRKSCAAPPLSPSAIPLAERRRVNNLIIRNQN
jgi:hypothetical protein